MYRKLFLPAVTLAIIAGMTGTAFLLDLHQKSEIPSINTASFSRAAMKQPSYRIGAYDGYITVFLPNQENPYLKTDIALSTLRLEDQKKITSGLYLYSQEELTSFLEDFGS